MTITGNIFKIKFKFSSPPTLSLRVSLPDQLSPKSVGSDHPKTPLLPTIFFTHSQNQQLSQPIFIPRRAQNRRGDQKQLFKGKSLNYVVFDVRLDYMFMSRMLKQTSIFSLIKLIKYYRLVWVFYLRAVGFFFLHVRTFNS